MDLSHQLEQRQKRILQRIAELELSLQLPQHLCISSWKNEHDHGDTSTTESRFSRLLVDGGVGDFMFKRVPFDYYDRTLEERRHILGAASIHHLCKSIVLYHTAEENGLKWCWIQSHDHEDKPRNPRRGSPIPRKDWALQGSHDIDSGQDYESRVLMEKTVLRAIMMAKILSAYQAVDPNQFMSSSSSQGAKYYLTTVRRVLLVSKVNTQAHASVTDCSDRNNSKYYVIVVQYTARLNAESIKNFLYTLNNGKIPKKKFNLRLAPEEESLKLTGFEHNAVTSIGMKTDIPVIIDEAIVKLTPDFFWLGGGEVDLKLGIRTPQFIDFCKPFVVNCS